MEQRNVLFSGVAALAMISFGAGSASAGTLAESQALIDGYISEADKGYGPSIRRANEADTAPDLHLQRYKDGLNTVLDDHNLSQLEQGTVPSPQLENPELMALPVGKVTVESSRMKASYVMDYLGLKEGAQVDPEAFQKAFFRFHGAHDTVLHIALAEGAKGTADWTIRCLEPRDVTVGALMENMGSKSVGFYQHGYAVRFNGISGRSDNLLLSGLFSTGSRSGLIDYTTPVGRAGDTLNLTYGVASLNYTDGFFEPFRVTGHSQMANVLYSHALDVKESGKTALNVSYRYYNAKLSTDVPSEIQTLYDYAEAKPDGSGLQAYAQAVAQIIQYNYLPYEARTHVVDVAYNRYTKGDSYMLSQNYGYRLGYATKELGGSALFAQRDDRSFGLAHAELLYRKYYAHGQKIQMLATGQWASTGMLSMTQQFYPGGINTVRGYKENLLFGDSGAALQLDYMVPLDSKKRFFADIFLDGAFVSGKGTAGQDNTRIASTGFGLRGAPADNVNVNLFLGFPLVRHLDGIKQNPHINFMTSYIF